MVFTGSVRKLLVQLSVRSPLVNRFSKIQSRACQEAVRLTRTPSGIEITSPRGTSKQPTQGTCVLLGWQGAKLAHLKRYSCLFESLGYQTIRATGGPLNTVFQANTQIRDKCLEVFDLLRHEREFNKSLFLYVFSGGGQLMYRHITKAFQDEPLDNISISGTVFDSAPVNPLPQTVVNGLQDIMDRQIKSSVLRESIMMVLRPIVGAAVAREPIITNLIATLKQSRIRRPELYLYSRADRITPYQDIEDFMTHRKCMGVPVVSNDFVDSEHVKHYIKYPEVYENILLDFIKECTVCHQDIPHERSVAA